MSPFRSGRARSQIRIKAFGIVFIFSVLFYTFWLRGQDKPDVMIDEFVQHKGDEPWLSKPEEAAYNSTLGFQKIMVLSKGPSWRTRGLIAAANHTGLDIEIPPQPHIATEMIDSFSKIGNEIHPSPGSAHAWLAHLDLVRYGVLSKLDTFLILEDDVDWDIALKKQATLISKNVRKFTRVSQEDQSPYGHEWDVLWLGHCGEHTDEDTPREEFLDPSVPMAADYTGWGGKYLPFLKSSHRAIQRGINPVCTFGYALTSHGAQKVLSWAGKGGHEAYDIRLMVGCKLGELECLVVQPEIMHHYTPSRALGYTSLVMQEDGKGESVDEEKYEGEMGGTENILGSVRCRVLFGSTCVKTERDY